LLNLLFREKSTGFKMLGSLALLLIFQLVGEVLAKALSLPIPGPVLGMLLLLMALIIRGHLSTDLKNTAQTLLSNLSLFFVPAGVGVILHINLLKNEWISLSLILIFSTLITMLITALVMTFLLKHLTNKKSS
jgi:holin-like protein